MKKAVSNENSIYISLGIILITVWDFMFLQNKDAISLFVVPLIFCILFVICAEMYEYFMYPGMFVVGVICTLRYVIIPSLILLDNNYTATSEILSAGIILFIYEEICVGIFLIFLTNRHYKRGKRFLRDDTASRIPTSNIGIFFVVIVLAAVVVVIINPSSLNKFNFFLSTSKKNIYKYGQVVSGISSLLLDWSKIILPLLLVQEIIRKYRSTHEATYYYLTSILMLFFNLMIFSGTSRSSAILPGVASLFFLVKIFPDKRKKTFLLVSIMIVLVTISLTIFKNSYISNSGTYTMSALTKYFEIYFSGPRNLGIAIKTKEMFGDTISIETFFNDIFANAPGISQFFNTENRTSTLFNIAYYDGGTSRDMIVPTIGQGLSYFGYVFSVIPELIFLWIVAKFDKAYLKAEDIMRAFFMGYFSIRFAFCFYQNVSIVASFVFNTVIPIMIFLTINTRLINEREGHHNRIIKNIE